MALTAGIIGLPNVGKSTLFNAITKSKVEMANYPFATIEPNVGMVEVPDRRLDIIQKLIPAKKVVPATFEFTDIAGLVKGASKGEGLGNKFLANIRQTDAIIHVVRAFDDKDISHVTGEVNPVQDIETINLELILADLETVNKRLDKLHQQQKGVPTKGKEEIKVLEKVKNALENEEMVRNVDLSEEEQTIVNTLFLLTQKPVLYVANISDDDIANPTDSKYFMQIKNYAQQHHAQVIPLSANSEQQISELDGQEKKEFLEMLGLKRSSLDDLIRKSYNMLDLETFFTVGGKENKAWTFTKGTKAPDAAGLIHSDFKRGFIRAEVMSFLALDKYKSEAKAKEAGDVRIEGKDYVMQDGDIVEFRFNV